MGEKQGHEETDFIRRVAEAFLARNGKGEG